jgi:AraC-like DNA-binding protein
VLEFRLEGLNYYDLLKQFSEKLKIGIVNNRIEIPATIGKGFIQVIDLPNGLQAFVSQIEFFTDVKFHLVKSTEHFCTLHFNELELTETNYLLNEADNSSKQKEFRAGSSVIAGNQDISYVMKAKTKSKSIRIILQENWVQQNLKINDEVMVLSDYTSKNSISHPNPFDAHNRMLFDEVFLSDPSNPMHQMILKNRIMLLLEYFLSKLYRSVKAKEGTAVKKLKSSDLNKLMEIESILVRDFSTSPPTITMLAERTGMSVSKLKTAFKKVYGTGIYEYYQKNRMQKARTLLLTGQYNVKEVGLHLGYTNLSNFSLAFKKEFGILPSQV